MTPLHLMSIPLLAAALVYLLRRFHALAALLSAGTLLLLLSLLWQIPLDTPVEILGRPFTLTALNRPPLLLVYLVSGLAFLIAWQVPQGDDFHPFGLLLLAVLGGAMASNNLIWSTLLTIMTLSMAAFLIQGGRPNSTRRGALRCQTVAVLTVSLLLPTFLLIDAYTLTPDASHLANFILVTLALGIGMLLGIVPFHGWLVAAGEDGPALGTVLLICLPNLAVLNLVFGLLNDQTWLADKPQVWSMMTLAGLTTALWGGLPAFSQRHLGRLLGYAALVDLGHILLGLGVGTSLGTTAALLHVVNRPFALLLTAVSLEVIRKSVGELRFEHLAGLAARLPVTSFGLAVGGLALAGFPLANTFPSHWLIYQAATRHNPLYGGALILANGGLLVGFMRGVYYLFSSSHPSGGAKEPWATKGIILALATVVLIGGLFPQYLVSAIQPLAASLLTK